MATFMFSPTPAALAAVIGFLLWAALALLILIKWRPFPSPPPTSREQKTLAVQARLLNIYPHLGGHYPGQIPYTLVSQDLRFTLELGRSHKWIYWRIRPFPAGAPSPWSGQPIPTDILQRFRF
jgi:hypothetical protein